ncbi:hypothetical protein BDR26DRAFT_872063 [Obelidium mucronatum]|nr:hypothetical protein BDR26DRAFT_872063 [Obelidium mucronatum]
MGKRFAVMQEIKVTDELLEQFGGEIKALKEILCKRPVWYRLVDADGEPHSNTDATRAFVAEAAIVDDLKTAVWDKNQKIIDGVAGQLKVYSNKEDIGDRTKVLEVDAPLKGMGEGEDTSLLVVVPDSPASKKRRVEKPTWKEESTLVDSLEDSSLDFVNRTDAILQLQKIHQAKFKRVFWGSGAEWIIPIADNVFGLGKSAFGRNYIRKSRETWPNFRSGALLEDSFNAVMIKLLCKALKDKFDAPPAVLSMPPKTADNFLEDLTDVCGPVFIVLDEIGKAFVSKKLNDFQQRKEFYRFSRWILDGWLSLKNVFFVVLGHASFINSVGHSPTDIDNMGYCSLAFKRLNMDQN